MRHNPKIASANRQLAAALAILFRNDEAQEAMKRVLELMPGQTIIQVSQSVPIKGPKQNRVG